MNKIPRIAVLLLAVLLASCEPPGSGSVYKPDTAGGNILPESEREVLVSDFVDDDSLYYGIYVYMPKCTNTEYEGIKTISDEGGGHFSLDSGEIGFGAMANSMLARVVFQGLSIIPHPSLPGLYSLESQGPGDAQFLMVAESVNGKRNPFFREPSVKSQGAEISTEKTQLSIVDGDLIVKIFVDWNISTEKRTESGYEDYYKIQQLCPSEYTYTKAGVTYTESYDADDQKYINDMVRDLIDVMAGKVADRIYSWIVTHHRFEARINPATEDSDIVFLRESPSQQEETAPENDALMVTVLTQPFTVEGDKADWKHPELSDEELENYSSYYSKWADRGCFLRHTSTTIGPYEIAAYETTYRLWREVYTWAVSREENKYSFQNEGQEGYNGTPGADSIPVFEGLPVVNISWRDMIVWCNAYSEKEGLEPVYYSDASFSQPFRSSVYDIGGHDPNVPVEEGWGFIFHLAEGEIDNPYVKADADGYRLPTEAEWEFACRGGDVNEPDWWFKYTARESNDGDGGGDDNDEMLDVGWNGNNAGKKPHKVGNKRPSRLGLYDIYGNVCEWLYDWVYLDSEEPDWNTVQITDLTKWRGRAVRGQHYNYGTSGEVGLGRRSEDWPMFYRIENGFRVARNYEE